VKEAKNRTREGQNGIGPVIGALISYSAEEWTLGTVRGL
jgi:hypothetical protein